MSERIVIIGAGEAGTAAALALREAGYVHDILLTGAEQHAPYERPPLSKNIITQKDAGLPQIAVSQQFAELNIIHLKESVVEIDRAAHEVVLKDGRRVRYSKLLLATGANPRRLTLPGAEHALYLRTFQDALALRVAFEPGKHIVVIGGGFIGLECAASARALGCKVTVVEAAPRILMRGVPQAVAAFIEERHRNEGVEFRIGTGLDRIVASGEIKHLHLQDGSMIEADTIIAGIGAVPEVTLAQAAGLELNNGVCVNSHLQTSDADIYAAGDCCSFPHPLYDNGRIRLEAWRNAQDQGRFVAQNMLGGTEIFAAVPWFWSDQYDMHLQVAGLGDKAHVVTVRETGEDAVLIFHLAEDGRLLAASGVGPIGKVAKDVRLAEMMIAKRATPDPAKLADPNVKLKSLL